MGATNKRVLVAGTTTDYVDLLRARAPGRVAFLTRPDLRCNAREPAPAPDEEFLADPDDIDRAAQLAEGHAQRHRIEWEGLACFDCESLAAAARIAQRLGLPWVSPRAVARCRDKRRAARLWRRAGLAAPLSRRVTSTDDAAAFQSRTDAPVVLKPADGSGSEKVFLCRDPQTCRSAFRTIVGDAGKDALACEWIDGTEYSCDFIVDEGKAHIVRLARKHPRPAPPFGIVLAYELPSDIPPPLRNDVLAPLLARAARALGIHGALCMIDFILRDDELVLLELAPRPGGDCLPPLLRTACGIDTLDLALRIARGENGNAPFARPKNTWIGVRFFADREGTLSRIDTSAVAALAGVREIAIARHPGDPIELPPKDCDSWILGYALVETMPSADIPSLANDINRALRVTIEPFATPHDEKRRTDHC